MKSNLSPLILTLMVASTSGSPAFADSAVVTQFLKGKIDLKNDSITLPLHQGSLPSGKKVWYVLTDVSDRATATRLGIGYAPALAAAAKLKGTRSATIGRDGEMALDTGSVDFAPARALTPGTAPDLFPPVAVQPGSVASSDYSPLVRVTDSSGLVVVFDAPILAFDHSAAELDFCSVKPDFALVHDRVIQFCPKKKEVVLGLARGFSKGKALVYLTFDANIPLAATLEGDTVAPALDELNGTAATLPLFAVTNGQTGRENPNRQGFNSAIAGEGSPLNILASFPTVAGGYSPLWDIQGVSWTTQAVAARLNQVMKSSADVSAAYRAGNLTGLGGGDVKTLGILVNCPAVAIIE